MGSHRELSSEGKGEDGIGREGRGGREGGSEGVREGGQ